MYNIFWGSQTFIESSSKITQRSCCPALNLHKNKPFAWSTNANFAFEGLKQAFTFVLILMHIDPMKLFILEADVYNFALGILLSQIRDDGQVHPVAFHSRKFEATEINYEIHDKELLAIVDSSQHILVYNDHKNLQYFQSARVFTHRQARWAQFLSPFDFIILYRPGIQQGKADALSQRSLLPV